MQDNVKVNESLSYRSDAIHVRAGQCTSKIGRGGVCTFCPAGHTNA